MKVCLITGIYKIVSPTGKVYIGQAWNIKRRFREYTYIWKSSQQKKLHLSLKKYGIEFHKFDNIHKLKNQIRQSEQESYEQLYMDFYKNCGIELMNLREAGSRGKHSQESKDKLSIAHTGKILSEETKKRISQNRKGKGTGSSNSMYGIGLIGNAKEKMRQSKIGTKASDETKRKMSESAKLRHGKRKKI